MSRGNGLANRDTRESQTMANASAQLATRVDAQLGITEEAGFHPDGLFGVTYTPAAGASTGVLICPAILSEYDHTYTIDVTLARELARRGVAVHRFHYRGTGHSDGEPAEMTFARMREDALSAGARFGAELGGREPIVLGLRFGALVAASVAGELGASPLVLLEAAVSARRYFREAWRADMMFQINEGGAPATTRDAFPDLLERDGEVDVLGYPVCRALFDSAVERTLQGEAAALAGRRVLIVRGGPPGSTRPDQESAAEGLRTAGCAVEVEVLAEPLVWWFQGPEMRRNARPVVADMIERIATWIAAVAKDAADAAVAADAKDAAPSAGGAA
jgi:pimeloyl-ACP methyl ester carboxylesterase